MPARHSPHFLCCTSLLVLCLFAGQTFAQSNERPKLKHFGSSLERLEWNAAQQATVESKRKTNQSKNSDADDVVRVETSLVVTDVLVLGQQGRPVQGLTAKDFVVTEEGKPQSVGMFSLGDNVAVPRSIVLIIDYSCIQLPYLLTSVAAARTLIGKLGPSDRMAIVTDDVELLVNYTNNKSKLNDGLDALLQRTRLVRRSPLERSSHIPFGRGFQYSALMAVLKEAFDDEDVRPIIVFQTQGIEASILQNPILRPPIPNGLTPDLQQEMDRVAKHHQEFMRRNKREFSLNDVYKAAETSRATIYTVVPGVRLIGLSVDEQITQMRALNDRAMSLPLVSKKSREQNQKLPRDILKWEAEDMLNLQSALAVLSTITGGWIEFLDQPSQAEVIYSRIFSDINRRYLVGYYPTNKDHDGKRRKISVEVRGHPEYLVMGRKAYYAPGPAQ